MKTYNQSNPLASPTFLLNRTGSLHLLFLTVIIGVLLSACSQKGIGNVVTDDTNPSTDEITAKIWPSQQDNFSFPEASLNLQKTGICMSGGGTRAMVCAVGQLKGLAQLRLLDNVGYISCVSGGSWASVPFTYYTDGAANDDQLLGTIVAPGDLTLDNMNSLTPGFLAGAANAPLLNTMIENLGKYPADEIWIQGVSQSYMEPFGLYNQNSPKYFSYDANTVNEICARNPSLHSSDFITVRNKAGDVHRPYLVVNSSISGPYNFGPFTNPEDLAVFNYTPLGIGSAMPQIAVYNSEIGGPPHRMPIGGGFIEPFAFGAPVPTSLPSICHSGSQRNLCLKLTKPTTPFSIADASGTSSSAFVASFTSHGIDGYSAKELSPQENYWPISSSIIPSAINQNFMFGDGGNLENLGVITLLQRKVKKLVVFVNTDTRLNGSYDTISALTPKDTDVSSDILTLFGIRFKGSEDMNQNKVFAEGDIQLLMKQFVKAKTQGKSIIASTQLTTVPNPWWGIPAGETVEIVWVYNDNVDEYLNQITDDAIRIQIKDLDGFPDFPFFPNYKTIDEDPLRLVKLSERQINLLYQFSAWNVYSNPNVFNMLKQ